jgi:hypothetical protein
MKLNLVLLALTLLLNLSGIASLSSPARADDNRPQMIEVVPFKAEAGTQMSWGQCPCFRWTVQIQGLGGGVMVAKEFLISSDAVFKMRQEMEADGSSNRLKLYRLGAVEALWTGGHVGMGYQGITWGDDPDHDYFDVVRTGLYGFINMILNDSIRFDVRSAAEFESMRVDYGSSRVARTTLDQSAVLHWKSGGWSGNVSASVGLDASHPSNAQYMRLGADASMRARLLSIGDLELGLNLNGSYDHDPFREILGLTADSGVFGVAMDLSYVMDPRDKH